MLYFNILYYNILKSNILYCSILHYIISILLWGWIVRVQEVGGSPSGGLQVGGITHLLLLVAKGILRIQGSRGVWIRFLASTILLSNNYTPIPVKTI